jgi:ureidoglycolate hydrolase
VGLVVDRVLEAEVRARLVRAEADRAADRVEVVEEHTVGGQARAPLDRAAVGLVGHDDILRAPRHRCVADPPA